MRGETSVSSNDVMVWIRFRVRVVGAEGWAGSGCTLILNDDDAPRTLSTMAPKLIPVAGPERTDRGEDHKALSKMYASHLFDAGVTRLEPVHPHCGRRANPRRHPQLVVGSSGARGECSRASKCSKII